MMRHGGGATDTATHLAYLDLPRSSAMGNKGFDSVGFDIGKVLQNLAMEAMEDGLLEEIRLTLEEKMKQWGNQPHPKQEKPLTYDEYVALPSKQRPYIDIVVSFDMGWQKKGSGHTYDSISGHAFMSGARARKILACMICCKLCGVCTVTEKVGKEPEEHECCKNYKGSSKGMEAFVVLELV